ncbi:hypothetical protein SDC9_105010 [bioreactor metagenome]|uniref:Uncharacterized protein n=1 Tax=bioreactor metagenome TaxID=1076179 RepID=A0A645B0V5_9ZZZZ
MSNIKIDIIGSCVTRDAFEFTKYMLLNNKYSINNYISKTSIISLTSNIIDKVGCDISNTKMTAWEKRQVEYDLNKAWINILKKSDSDIIIIDLIDERYDICSINGTYFTKSNLFNKLKFKSDNNIEIKNRFSEDVYNLWFKSVESYIYELKKLKKKVLVHKALWKNEYVNNNINKSLSKNIYLNNIAYSLYYGNIFDFRNKIRKFNNITQVKIEKNNKILNEYYNVFTLEKDFQIIEILKDFKCDKGHKWGLAPFHYESDYYVEFIKILDRIVSSEDI